LTPWFERVCPLKQAKMISGLHLAEEVVTPEEEFRLVDYIEMMPWDTTLSRRVQQYGHSYVYKSEEREVTPVQEWALDLFEKCRRVLPIPETPYNKLQVIVNEYAPGQGISKHIDNPRQFGEWVLTVSLGSPATMVFSKEKEEKSVTLLRRSAYLMTGEARYDWKHSIPARKGDRTGTRISVTFRRQK
jgi:alkylated DNA repair dioxygenase AlkB